MVKLNVIGTTAMYGLYIGLGAYIVKSICAIIFGYLYFPVEYAGPSYYYWRHKYCDESISKTSFDPLAKNADLKKEPFLTYIKTVQPFAKKAKLEKKLEAKNEELKKAEASVEAANKITGSDKQAKLDKASEALAKIKEEISELSAKIVLSEEFNELGFTALLNTPGFSEGFAYDSKKNYKVFKTTQNGNENNALVADFHFLAYRYLFIQYLKKINPKSKNWSSITEEQLKSFIEATPSVKAFTPSKLLSSDNTLQEVVINDMKDVSVKVPQSYVPVILGYFKAAPMFQAFVKRMSESTPLFKAVDNKLVFENDNDFEAVKSICQEIGLLSFFEKDGVTDDKAFRDSVEAFVTRVGSIKTTALDIQILNRIYYFYLITYSDMTYKASDNNKDIAENLETEEKMAKVLAIMNNNSENKKSTAYVTADRKYKVLLKAYEKKRIEQRLNAFSEIIASTLGSKGFTLDSKDDSRIPVLKYFAYPNVYSAKKKAQVASPFSSSSLY